MTVERRLRADAARNADRVLRAARDVYAADGPGAAIDAIARVAGVGERTLYRHFPSKGQLIRAALDQSIAENLAPVIARARSDPDPLRGLIDLMTAAISLGAQEHNLLAAARRAGVLAGVSADLDDALADLMLRAQASGRVRPDLVVDDLPRVTAMLFGALSTMDPASGGWRRYVTLVVDGMTTPDGRRLSAAPPVRLAETDAEWPM